VGSHIAAVTEVVSESEGVLTIECSSSVWSQELDLMEPRLRASLAEKIQGEPPQKLRFSTAS
jgi:predicted nucleic acid-binding Zn ribbon protein